MPVIALTWLVDLPPKGDFKVTIKARVERSILGAIRILKKISILAIYSFRRFCIVLRNIRLID